MKVGRHRLEGTIAELRATLDRAAAEDEVAEQRVRTGRTQGCLGCGVAVAAVGIPMTLSDMFGPNVALGLALGLGLPALLWALWTLYRSRRLLKEGQAEDLDDVRLETVRKLLRLLAADVSPQARMRLEVDFREAAQGEFVDPTASAGKQVWCQPWLLLRGRLADGTLWRVAVERRMSRKRKPKSKGRVKITERFRDRLVLDVKVDPKRYGDLTTLPQRTPPPPPPLQVLQGTAQGDRARAVLATPEAQTVTARGAETKLGHELLAGPEAILASLVWLYKGLSSLRV